MCGMLFVVCRVIVICCRRFDWRFIVIVFDFVFLIKIVVEFEVLIVLLVGVDQMCVDVFMYGCLGDLFVVLGLYCVDIEDGVCWVVCVFYFGVCCVQVIDLCGQIIMEMMLVGCMGLFYGLLCVDVQDVYGYLEFYCLCIIWFVGIGYEVVQEIEDLYVFGLLLGDLDLYLFNEGMYWVLVSCLGVQVMCIDGISGVCFVVWVLNV